MHGLVIEMKISSKGGTEPFSETKQTYRDLSYEDVMAVQKAIADALVGLGYAKLAKEKK